MVAQNYLAEATGTANEIGLYDLWSTLLRRWRIVLTLFAVVSLTALAFAVARPERYEFTSLLEIGQVSSASGSRLLESPDAVRLRLEKGIVPRVRRELAGPAAAAAPVLKIDTIAGQGAVTLTSTAPMEHLSVHTAVADALRTLHAQRLEQETDALLAPLQSAVAALAARKEALQQTIALASAQADRGAGTDPRQDFLLATRLADLRSEAFQIDGKIVDHQREIETIRRTSRETRVAELASQADRPLGPGRGLIIALGTVLGLVAGALAAFVAEAFANGKRAASSRAT